MSPQEVLKHYWGYNSFREKQEKIIQSVLEGKDTLALLPTGGGKSICFQVPALCMEGICLVISPLIALMKDQVEQLQRRGIQAKAIYSGMSAREIDIILDNCIYGEFRFLYISPERLKTKLFLERVGRMNVNLVAIDEAHCISQWGYDFRPSYLEITHFLKELPDAKRIALTATATREVREDILDKLGMANTQIFQKTFARSNLSYSVFHLETKEQKLLEILSRVPGTGIVYVRTRRRTQAIAAYLKSNGIAAEHYHAGLSGEERNSRQEQWITNKIRVIVSTNAFGMGIDKPDVRTVIHLDVPESLEAYYQEAGRAGRDERKAYAVLLFQRNDLSDLMEKAKSREVSKAYIQQVYQSLANYYQMAVGSHGMETLPFDLEAFCKSFDLLPIRAVQALRNLEECGVLQLSDTVYQLSKLNIRISKEELYKYQVANIKFEPVLKSILRLYGGELFLEFRMIKEADLATMCKTSRKIIEDQLTYLHEQGIVDYKPASDHPSLTFLIPRMNAHDLPIDVELIRFRKETALKKAQAMIGYVESSTKCRTRIFQNYFDEKTLENCGVCDYCLERKRMEIDVPLRRVLEVIKNKPSSLKEISQVVKSHTLEKIMLAIRLLIEDDRIRIQDGRYELN